MSSSFPTRGRGRAEAGGAGGLILARLVTNCHSTGAGARSMLAAAMGIVKWATQRRWRQSELWRWRKVEVHEQRDGDRDDQKSAGQCLEGEGEGGLKRSKRVGREVTRPASTTSSGVNQEECAGHRDQPLNMPTNSMNRVHDDFSEAHPLTSLQASKLQASIAGKGAEHVILAIVNRLVARVYYYRDTDTAATSSQFPSPPLLHSLHAPHYRCLIANRVPRTCVRPPMSSSGP